MYGTIAKIEVQNAKVAAFQGLADSLELAPGQLGRYVFRLDANPQAFMFVALFTSREAYQANAQSPAQHERFMTMRAMLTTDPEWYDGEVVDMHQVTAA